MDTTAILFAKIAALKKNFSSIVASGIRHISGPDIEPLFLIYTALTQEAKNALPELYSDLPQFEMPQNVNPKPSNRTLYGIYDLIPLFRNIEYILEVRANSRIGEKIAEKTNQEYIFISHGKSKEWYKIQVYLEKDLNYRSIELAQQPNLGRTILQKLNDESEKCFCSIIIMTGDDFLDTGELRARENVMHEIGFFQGKLGLERIILLHEEGVNIPSNIHGLVYIPFPKDTIEATLGAIQRELRVICT